MTTAAGTETTTPTGSQAGAGDASHSNRRLAAILLGIAVAFTLAVLVGARLVMQRAADQLAESTVGQFVGDPDVTASLGFDPETHPLDLPAAHLRLAQLAQVFAQQRPLVLLDEPDVGLDSASRDRAHALISAGLHRGQAVIFTCHDESFAEEVGEYSRAGWAAP